MKSLRIPAARRPAIHNPTVVHLSLKPLHFCHHTSSAFYLVVPQPSSAETSTLRRNYILFPPFSTDIREDAKSHRVIYCKYLSRSFCTAVGWASQTGFCISGSFFSTYFFLLVWWRRGWSNCWCRLFTIIVSETALVSSRTLAFCIPLVTNTFSSFNAT